MQNHYVVIMAGGSGTRLWPLSRKDNPKQFQNLTSEDRTLLQETYDRISPLADDLEHIFVATTQNYENIVKEQLPDLPPQNIILEPCGRDTAPAIAFATQIIYKKDPDAVITTTPSDHAIKNPGAYLCTVQTAFAVIADHPEKFGLIGITPTEPSTELGYIQMGTELENSYKKRVFEAVAFKEKPDVKTAEKYLNNWSYLWNAAYFVFKADTFLRMVQKFTPHIHDALTQIDATDDADAIHSLYCGLPKEPIDTVILEQLSAKDRFVVPADLEWSDVGNWRTLHDFHRCDNGQKSVTRGKVVEINSHNCLVFGHPTKTIATLGLNDIVVIDTDDAILITHRDQAHEVKKIIDHLKDQEMDHLL
ncbi:MAG: sugar phosphate nucleotidyltransferase [Parcubacteria group bacterium]|jgi:mannose-1-phosphate guanylyltransferase